MKRRLKTSTTCPLCHERIGIAAGFKALTPFMMRCPQCRVLLRVRMPGMLLYLSALVIVIALIFVSLPLAKAVFGVTWHLWYALLWLGVGLIAEVATSVLFFTYATFTPFHVRLRLRR